MKEEYELLSEVYKKMTERLEHLKTKKMDKENIIRINELTLNIVGVQQYLLRSIDMRNNTS